ncbi:MAG: phosphate signaling complex protein PhoU [Spirochaetales bacterium]|nr:phosphate signaling complex protein PhoU [Spirochaetales bacterium]
MSIRQHFDDEIGALNKDILKMGLMVEEAVKNGIEAFKNQDRDLAKTVIAGDDGINNMENELCDQCAILLAKEQPVASDLRHIVAAIKIITQLERIGDHGVHLARKAEIIAGQDFIKPIVDLPRMEEIARKMLVDSLNAYVERDSEAAEEIASRDKMIDDLYNQVVREILTLIMGDSQKIEQGVELLYVARYLERFGDHVKNICEWVIFSERGEHADL